MIGKKTLKIIALIFFILGAIVYFCNSQEKDVRPRVKYYKCKNWR